MANPTPRTLSPTIPKPHLAVIRWQWELQNAMHGWYWLSAALLALPSMVVLAMALDCLDVAGLVADAVDRAQNANF